MNITPLEQNQWSDIFIKSPFNSPFYTYEWLALTSNYFNADLDLVLVDDDNGKKWATAVFKHLPWQNSGNASLHSIGYGSPVPIGNHDNMSISVDDIKKIIIEIGKWQQAETINAVLFPSINWPKQSNISHSTVCIYLHDNIQDTFTKVLFGNVRTAVRKAENKGVVVREIENLYSIEFNKAITLLHETQERVGSSYLTDPDFVRIILQKNTNQFTARMYVADYKGSIASMAITVSSISETFHLFHGWDRNLSNTSANQALIWHMISETVISGRKIFNMGSSHSPELQKAKLRYGGEILSTPRLAINI